MEIIKKINGLGLVKIGMALLFALVALPSNAKAIAILLFGATVLIFLFQRKWHFDFPFFIKNAVLFIVIGLTYFYSADTEFAQKKLLTMSSLLVFPFIFSLFTREEAKSIFKHFKIYLWIYVIGVFLMNIVPFLWFYTTHYTFEGIIEHFATIVRVDMGKFSIHPIYLSMHCSVAILFSFYILRELKSKKLIVALLAIDISLVLFLLLYAKKGPLIALIVMFSLFVAFQRKQKLVKPYLIAVTALIILTLAIPKTRDKFVELLKIENINEGDITSTNIRYTIYNTAKKLIAKAPITGYGIGDYNNVLLEQYKEDGNSILVEGKYNAHDQYFSLLLIGGVFALLALIITMGINLVFAIRYDNQILILLLIFYGIVMFTENILERETGVIYFSIFLNFFGLFNRDMNN